MLFGEIPLLFMRIVRDAVIALSGPNSAFKVIFLHPSKALFFWNYRPNPRVGLQVTTQEMTKTKKTDFYKIWDRKI
jgi:hypothetical protein